MRRRTTRWLRSTGTGLIVVGTLMAVVALTPAAAGAKSAASGTITCSAVTGTVTFKPGLQFSTLPKKHHGISKMKVTLDLAKSGCVVGGDSNPVGDTGNVTAKSTVSSQFTCGTLGTNPGPASSWTVKWGGKLTSSVVGFPDFKLTSQDNLEVINYPAPVTGNASVTGSYPGADAGASSTLVYDTSTTVDQAETACDSSAGLTSMTVTSGSFFVG
jgi:hypothetical protein